ncbi:uncharacterized protein BDR25DRAFT_396041 [Lindgomyces ingoldianus]|uniref:Uncharacterized protein n=1 Tax=Lindgomyces ingoldianus TaxID=673940 RepID=A0ACB6QHC4_9PLEO|nr:uncharacterized protein BDR25DRAFT_396041 [Lindgomyces ingoldianus]KAF2465968.1 hypothetical protein BDR25DRAFT_396041 [Lindgomyces ingoldianus]
MKNAFRSKVMWRLSTEGGPLVAAPPPQKYQISFLLASMEFSYLLESPTTKRHHPPPVCPAANPNLQPPISYNPHKNKSSTLIDPRPSLCTEKGPKSHLSQWSEISVKIRMKYQRSGVSGYPNLDFPSISHLHTVYSRPCSSGSFPAETHHNTHRSLIGSFLCRVLTVSCEYDVGSIALILKTTSGENRVRQDSYLQMSRTAIDKDESFIMFNSVALFSPFSITQLAAKPTTQRKSRRPPLNYKGKKLIRIRDPQSSHAGAKHIIFP